MAQRMRKRTAMRLTRGGKRQGGGKPGRDLGGKARA